MTRGEIKALARAWLDDDSGGYFTDAIMDRFINQAQREAQKCLIRAGENFYTKCVETSTVADQRDYALPTDFMKLLRLERITQGSGDTASTERLHPLTTNEIDVSGYQNGSSGDSYNYVVNQSTFALYPVPNSVKVLRLTYVYRVGDMSSDGDTPDVPVDYHEYMAILAARDGFLRDGRSIAPIERKLMYYDDLFRENAESRTLDSPRQIVSTTDGFGSI